MSASMESLAFLGVGLVVGFTVGWLIGLGMGKKSAAQANGIANNRDSKSKAVPRDSATGVPVGARNPLLEVFSLHITRIDVQRKSFTPVQHHLSDVSCESKITGRVGHGLKVVVMGYGEDASKFEDEPELLHHFAEIHRQCSHLPIWLDNDTLELYLRLVFCGLQAEAGTDPKARAAITWGHLRDDLLKRMPVTMKADLGEDTPDKTIAGLVEDGMQRIDRVLDKLDVSRRLQMAAGPPSSAAGLRAPAGVH